MSRHRLPPPLPEPCLTRSYAARGQKGGTLIAEDVGDLEAHRQRLGNPDGYRPRACAREDCGAERLHVHERRERKLLGQESDAHGAPSTDVLVFICAACGATWRVLPSFIARHLWRSWPVVERETLGRRRATDPVVPSRTIRRWTARLAQSALVLVQLLATSGARLLRGVAQGCGLEASRAEFVAALAGAFASPAGLRLAHAAALIHRLHAGDRLM